MELKEYQSKALDAFDRWRNELEAARTQAETGIKALREAGVDVPPEIRNYPRSAWQSLAESGSVALPCRLYVDRTDEAGRPIPHVCFKIPTGGGKTLLAAAALERLNRQTGLTLWITPTRAIYQQTKGALWNREHPYRQMLERASGGRIKLLEKDDPFTAGDVANYLCVMLLMLPAANRQKGRDFLRMFRDTGRYPTLFPDGDDLLADGRLLERCPDLERAPGGPVKHSLFNLFKMLRPVVVLDEAHKAYGKPDAARDFVRSVNRLNPSLVIELSATPTSSISNLLVDISGVELKEEEMIKLPVQVTSFTGSEWRHTLGQAYEELERIEAEAQHFLETAKGRYIRPIAVVRVERTGKDQRDGERVHAEDVREYLTLNLGAPANAVRVKSAENDELGREDLLSPYSEVRWIITKSALMEGWDCPFAYLLVMLDNTSAQRAITQLVGRVMRQPHAQRTGREALDQCYVYCCNTDVGVAVGQVKSGLEQEGLAGLGDQVIAGADALKRITLERRQRFQGQDIFLPMVNHRHGDGWQELDYQRHILPEIPWESVQAHDPQGAPPNSAQRQQATVDAGDVATVYHPGQELYIDKTVSILWFTRRLTDIVPNPWQAARIAQEFIQKRQDAGENSDSIFKHRNSLASTLRERVAAEVEKLAEQVFRDKRRRNEISFDLESGGHNFQMVENYDIPVSIDERTLENYGRPLQLSLFQPVLERHFESDLERNFARYLDEQKALQWWHRVAARQQGDYYLRGWNRYRIWPDFVAMTSESYGRPQILVFDTKGKHLSGNSDTEYKRKVFEELEAAFNTGSAGAMTIRDGPAKGIFRLVFSDVEFPQALACLNVAYKA